MFSSTRTSLSFISFRCTSKISSIWALVSNDLSCFLTGVEVPFILLKFGDDIDWTRPDEWKLLWFLGFNGCLFFDFALTILPVPVLSPCNLIFSLALSNGDFSFNLFFFCFWIALLEILDEFDFWPLFCNGSRKCLLIWSVLVADVFFLSFDPTKNKMYSFRV